MLHNLTSLVFLISAVSTAYTQNSVLGKWKTIDDSSGNVKSIVELYIKGGSVHGKILEIFPAEGEETDPICKKCPENDSRHNSRIIGMEILKNMKQDGEAYSGGTVLDPESGSIYRCKLWLEKDQLKIRGYWGPFYRTQTWVPVN